MRKKLFLLTAFALVFSTQFAQAQFFKEPALEALFAAKNYSELAKIANARIAEKPEDAQAVLASSLIALRGANSPEDSLRRKTSIAQAEVCVAKTPDAAVCHYALGSTLGIQAMSEGMIKMASSVGKIKESLTQAVALDQQWFPARSALVNFYLIAPGLVGGSKSKARDFAQAAPNPDHARALEAYILLNDDKHEAALQSLNAIKPGTDRYLNDEIFSWTAGAAIGLVNHAKAEAARPTFERLIRERPLEPNGWWGMARVNAEAGNHVEAIKLFNSFTTISGAQIYPTDYRLGISYQALGQKEQARAAFTKFISSGKGGKKALEDAKSRLEALKN